jgi:HEAT repeat protein
VLTAPETRFGIFLTDTALTVRTWDDWLAAIACISADEAIGQPLTALAPDLEARGLLARFQHVLNEGVVELLAPALHHYLFPCPPANENPYFEHMRQRVVIAPLRDGEHITGAIVTVEDVTERMVRERAMLAEPGAAALMPQAEVWGTAAERHSEADFAAMGLVAAMAGDDWRARRGVVEALVKRREREIVTLVVNTLRAYRLDANTLNSALQVLSQSRVDITEPLIALLGDEEAEVRMYAALALGQRRDPRVIPALLHVLDDSDVNVRYHAIEALGRLGAHEAVAPLLTIAEAGDFFLGFPALDALRRIGDPSAAARIVPLLGDEMLSAAAAEALGALGDVEAVAPLMALLDEPRAPCGSIAGSLAALYDRYETRFEEGGLIADTVRCEIRPVGVQRLLHRLETAPDAELPALVRVVSWLEGEAVHRALFRLLGQPAPGGQPRARKEVVEALVRHGKDVTELLVEYLDVEDLETCHAAVTALGRIGDARAVPRLTEMLAEGGPETMIAAAGALARIGDRRAMAPLLTLLEYPHAAVRQAAIAALNSIGHPDLAEQVTALLEDPNPVVRESAVRIAGYFGYPRCAQSVADLCSDASETVRAAAVENIVFMEHPDVRAIVLRAMAEDTPKVRAAAARALAHLEGIDVLEGLLRALEDEDGWVRYFTARSLGRHSYPEAVPALVTVLQSDPVKFVRAASMVALGQIGGGRAAAALAPVVEDQDDDLAMAAIEALGMVAHPNALPPLLALVRATGAAALGVDPALGEARRIAALGAIGRRGGPGAAGALQWVAAADDAPAVWQAAIIGLADMATSEAVAALIALAAEPSRRDACISALAGLPHKRLDEVAQGLRHPHPVVRAAVVEALARKKQPAASEYVVRALQDKDAGVRMAAASALAQMGSLRADEAETPMVRG